MHASAELLTIFARQLAASLDSSVLSDVVIAANEELATGLWDAWHAKRDAAALRDAVTELAQATPENLDAGVDAALGGLEADGETAKSLGSYLRAFPGYVRRAFRRPSQPQGNVPPPNFSLGGPRDLLPLLPPRLPWFGAGDRPWNIGDWELVELLDMTGAGETWKAISPRDEKVAPVALHFLVGAQARAFLKSQDSAILERILLHGRVPGVLALEQIHGHADPPCLQYAWEDAGDLGSLIAEWNETNAKLDPRSASETALKIAEILGRLHTQTPALLHRRLQPENVRVLAAEGKWEVKLAGLGLGSWVDGREKDDDLYAEPTWVAAHPPQASEDVYALGVLWYQLLMRDVRKGRPGGLAWRRELLRQGMTAGLLDVLEKCWEDEPAERHTDGQALAVVLGAELAKSQPAAPAAPTAAAAPEAAPPRSRGRRANLDQLFDSIERTAPERSKLVTNAVGMKLVLIPAGSFLMGSPPEEPGHKANEGPVHEVHLTKDFYLGIHPVTQEQYQIVMGVNPARFSVTAGGGLDHPVENVTWDDAVQFCRKLSEREEEKKAGRRYRLPTEAEWEYACRAGTSGVFSFGAALLPGQANFDTSYPLGGGQTATALQTTSRVGAYPANHFGLHDMHGNVWEWCADWLDSGYYRLSPRRDPTGPANGQFRVIRGGSWRNHAVTCRSAYRNGLAPTARDTITGFRVVLES